jgi:hypothetical protein
LKHFLTGAGSRFAVGVALAGTLVCAEAQAAISGALSSAGAKASGQATSAVHLGTFSLAAAGGGGATKIFDRVTIQASGTIAENTKLANVKAYVDTSATPSQTTQFGATSAFAADNGTIEFIGTARDTAVSTYYLHVYADVTGTPAYGSTIITALLNAKSGANTYYTGPTATSTTTVSQVAVTGVSHNGASGTYAGQDTHIGSFAFTLTGAADLASVTLGSSGTVNESTELSNVRAYLSTSSTPATSGTQFGGGSTFAANDGTLALTGTSAMTAGTKYLHVYATVQSSTVGARVKVSLSQLSVGSADKTGLATASTTGVEIIEVANFTDGAETGATYMNPTGYSTGYTSLSSWAYETTATKVYAGTTSFRAGDGTINTRCTTLESPVLKLRSGATSELSFRALLDLQTQTAAINYDWIVFQIATEAGGYADWSTTPFAAYHTTTQYSTSVGQCGITGGVVGGTTRDGNTSFATQGEAFGPVSLASYAGQKIKLRWVFYQDYATASQAWIDQISVTNVISYLDATPAGGVVAGVPFNLAATVRDKNGSVNTGYTGTLQFSSSDGAAGLPSSYAFTGGDAGRKSFAVTLNTQGAQTVTLADSLISAISVTLGATVTDPADTFLDGAETGSTWMPLSSNAGTAPLAYETTPASVDQGSRSFHAGDGTTASYLCEVLETPILKLQGSGSSTLSFRALLDLESVASSPTYASDYLAVQIASETGEFHDWTTTPFASWHTQSIWSTTPCNSKVGSNKVIGGIPRDGNTDFFTQGEPFGPASLASYLGKRVKIRFLFGQSFSVASQAWLDQIMVTDVEPYFLLSGLPPDVVAGVAYPITLKAMTQQGAVNTSYTGTVGFSSTDPLATLPGNTAFTLGDAGVKTFSVTFGSTGSRTITVQDTGNANLTVSRTSTVAAAASLFVDGAETGQTYANLSAGTSPWVYETSADKVDAQARSFRAGDGVTSGPLCQILETPVLRLNDTSTASLSFRALLDLQDQDNWTGSTLDWLAVQMTTEDSGFTAWTGAPFSSLNTAYIGATAGCPSTVVPNGSYVIGGPTRDDNQDFSLQGEKFGPVPLPGYEGKRVKFRFVFSQDSDAVASQAWLDQISVTQVEPFMLLSGMPANSQTGIPLTLTVSARTASGALDPSYLGTVFFTSTDPAANLPASYTFTAGDAGSRTFNVTFNSDGQQWVTVTGTGGLSAAASSMVEDISETFLDGAETGLTWSNPAALGTGWYYETGAGLFAEGSRSFRAGNGVSGYRCDVLETPILQLQTDAESQFSAQGLFDLEATTWGDAADWLAFQIATESGGFTNWSAAPFSSLHTIWYGTTPGCGWSFYSGYVFGGTGRDGGTSYGGQGETVGPASLSDYQGQKVKLRVIFSQDASVVASQAWLDQLKVTSVRPYLWMNPLPTGIVTGTPTTVTVVARDRNGNVDPSFTGTVHFTSTDPAATLPANYQFTAGDAGTRAFPITFGSAGSFTVTVVNLGNLTDTHSATASVTQPADDFVDGAEAGATYMDLSPTTPGWVYETTSTLVDVGSRSFRAGDGTTATNLCEIMETPVLKLKSTGAGQLSFRGLFDLEASGTTYNYDWLAVQVASEDGGFTNWTTAPFSAWHTQSHDTTGCTTAVFPSTSYAIGGPTRDNKSDFATQGESMTPASLADYAGKRIKLRFLFSQDSVIASRAAVDEIRVTNTEPYFEMTALTDPATKGTSYGFTITARTRNGAANTGYTGTVAFSSSDAAAVLPGGYTFVPADNGSKSFTVTFNTAGLQSITVTDAANSLSSSATTRVEDTAGGFLDNADNGGAFKYMVNVNGWDVSNAVTPPSGQYSYRQTGSTRGCFRLETPEVRLRSDVQSWLEFKARMNFLLSSGTTYYEALVVEIGTAEAGYSDWDSAPLSSIHQQSRVTSVRYGCNLPTATIAANSAVFNTYRQLLPSSYNGKTVKLRFTVAQYPSTVNTLYLDDVKIMGTQPFLKVSGYPDPAEEMVAGSATIQAKDVNGQNQTTNNSSVTLSSDSPVFSYGGAANLVNGTVTMNNVKFVAGEWRLNAAAGTSSGSQIGVTVNPAGFANSPMTRFLVDSLPNPFYSGGAAAPRLTAATAAGGTVANYWGGARLISAAPGFTAVDTSFAASDLGQKTAAAVTLGGSGSQTVTATERGTVSFGDDNNEHALTQTDDAANYLTATTSGQDIRSGLRAWFITFGSDVNSIPASEKLTFPALRLRNLSEGKAYLKLHWKGSGSHSTSGATNYFYLQRSLDSGATWLRLSDTGSTNYNTYPRFTVTGEANPCATTEYEASEEKLARGSSAGLTVFGNRVTSWQEATFDLSSLQLNTGPRRVDFRIRFCASGWDVPLPLEDTDLGDGFAIDDVRVEGVDSFINASDVWSGSQTVTVTDVGAFDVTGLSSPFESQALGNVTVTAKDGSGNTLRNYTGTVTFDETVLGTQAEELLPANYAFTLADQGVHTFTNAVRLVTAGARTLRVRDTVTTAAAGTQSTTVVESGTALQVEKVASTSAPPGSVSPGASSVLMGTYAFSVNKLVAPTTDLTSIKITLDGNATASDVTGVRLHFDTDSSFANGTQASAGTQTFSGSPPSATFSALSGWTVGSTARYVHVEIDFAAGATVGAVVGAKLAAAGDVVNSVPYAFYALKSPPLSLGTSTILAAGTTKTWVGVNTSWDDAGNWSPTGVPGSTNDVLIAASYYNPTLTGTRAVKSLTVSTGTLTLSGSSTLIVDGGSFVNTASGSFVPGTGTVLIQGSAANQTLSSKDALNNLTLNKSSGTLVVGSSLTVNGTVTLSSGTLEVGSGQTLTLARSLSVAKTLSFQASSTLKMATGTTLTVPSGGTLTTNISNATNDPSLYATLTRATTGTYSVVVQSGGTVNLRYSNLRYLDANGLQVLAGATISASGLNNVFYRNPPNSGTLLKLSVAPPGGTITGTGFYADGATGVVNVNGATNTTFSVSTAGGDRNGNAYEVQQGSTVINWATEAGPAAKLVFTSSPVTVNASACSGAITVTLKDENNTTVNAASAYSIALTSSSAGGEFFTGSSCTPATEVSSLTLPLGQNTLTFYYKDSFLGTPTLTASEVPSAGLTDATQSATINAQSGTPARLAVQGPPAVATGVCSPEMEVVTLDAGGTEVSGSSATTVLLTGGGKALYYLDSGCTIPVNSITVTASTSRASFYYKHDAAGASYRICRHRKPSTGILMTILSSNLLYVCAETDDY